MAIHPVVDGKEPSIIDQPRPMKRTFRSHDTRHKTAVGLEKPLADGPAMASGLRYPFYL